MDDLQRLDAFVNRDTATAGAFSAMGFLVLPPDQFDEWVDCPPPPPGGMPFATTGGESDYYLMPDRTVVLYVPLEDSPYVVVGADLREFLALAVLPDGSPRTAHRRSGDRSRRSRGRRRSR